MIIKAEQNGRLRATILNLLFGFVLKQKFRRCLAGLIVVFRLSFDKKLLNAGVQPVKVAIQYCAHFIHCRFPSGCHHCRINAAP
ncbi:protein of unknown function [Georgfuchsia toluolica]|uniref:Uncharacterized protein n=1 Tax=Georgfuchsia toluolica TaxID=424218 RepID=A0A916J3A4_9PROT|nr:protein of unknown function [Georgfuchsia toluolica]